MKRFFLIAYTLLMPGLVFSQERDQALKSGDVFVPPELRVRNQNGNCVWCAAEDCFWGAAGWEEFLKQKERAVREGWGGAGMHNVLKACHDAGIDVVSTEPLTVNGKPSPFVHVINDPWQVLADAIDNQTGCYVEIPGHAIMVVGADEDGVRILDNNGDLKVQSWSARRFKSAWERHACFPLFNRRRHPKPEPKPDTPPPQPEVKPGPAGPAGPQGPPGKDGTQGPAGPPGKDADTAALLAKIAELQKQLDALKPSPAVRVRIVPSDSKKG